MAAHLREHPNDTLGPCPEPVRDDVVVPRETTLAEVAPEPVTDDGSEEIIPDSEPPETSVGGPSVDGQDDSGQPSEAEDTG